MRLLRLLHWRLIFYRRCDDRCINTCDDGEIKLWDCVSMLVMGLLHEDALREAVCPIRRLLWWGFTELMASIYNIAPWRFWVINHRGQGRSDVFHYRTWLLYFLLLLGYLLLLILLWYRIFLAWPLCWLSRLMVGLLLGLDRAFGSWLFVSDLLRSFLNHHLKF